MKIRAHHLLCMQGFQGYGYSKDFIDNLRNIIIKLKAHPETEIELIDECDAICASCPHNKKDRCDIRPEANETIQQQDRIVLGVLGLSTGTKITIKDVHALIQEKINTPSTAHHLCGDCPWKMQCLWFIKQTNRD